MVCGVKKMKNVSETKKIDLYMNGFLDSFIKQHSYEETKEALKNIIMGKRVEGLDDYSKKILSLDVEKLILMSIEYDYKIKNKRSNWKDIQKYFPLKEKSYLLNYIDLFLENRKNVGHKSKNIKDIFAFYNKIIDGELKSISNKLFRLPSKEKISVSDLMIAINNSLNNFEANTEKKKIKGKLANTFKMALPLASLTTALTVSALSNSKNNIEENSYTIICVNESSDKQKVIDEVIDLPKKEEKIEEETIERIEGDVIEIPDNINQSGICKNYTNYSYYYDKWNKTSKQRVIADEWHNAGRTNDRGIATLDGKYLVAMSRVFGNVGDNVIVVLENGESIECIIADAKGTDATNVYGHVLSSGVDIIEWESFGSQENIDLGSWQAQRVSHVINLDGINNLSAKVLSRKK